MRLLMLSRDPKIFDDGSDVRRRMLEYAKSVEELRIVVFARGLSSRAKSRDYNNMRIYPARSLPDMYKMGSSILRSSQGLRSCEDPSIEHSNQWVITAQDPFETGFVGYLLKQKRKIPLELQIHTDFLSPYFWKESLKNKIRVLLAQWLIKKADKIRVVSDRIKNSLLALCPKPYTLNPIEVRPVFVDVEKIKKSPIKTDLRQKYPGKFIILMASRLTKEKNIGLAINAMKEILKRKTLHPTPYTLHPLLLIVGDGPEREELELRIKNYELSDNVKIEPHTDDIVSYYKTADLFLLTSNYEGYGRTVVEAQAAGLPVLMTDVGVAIGEVFPVGDKAALVAALKKMIDNSTTPQ